jgi:hypothetical protein
VEIARAVMDEAAKLHLATEYLSACSIANGHGWSLCQLLADLLDHSIRHLKVSGRCEVLDLIYGCNALRREGVSAGIQRPKTDETILCWLYV